MCRRSPSRWFHVQVRQAQLVARACHIAPQPGASMRVNTYSYGWYERRRVGAGPAIMMRQIQ